MSQAAQKSYNVHASLDQQLSTLGVSMADTVLQVKSWRSIRRTDSLQLLNSNLNSLAIIATFLAAVQAQAISFSLNNNTTILQNAVNALFFGGLLVDVLGGTIAIVGSIQLQRTHELLKQRDSSLAGLEDVLKNIAGASKGQDMALGHELRLVLAHHLRFLGEIVVFPPLHSPRLWATLSVPLGQSARLVEQILKELEPEQSLLISATYSLSDYRHATNGLIKYRLGTSVGLAASLTAPYIVLAGLCCFTAGALCLARDSQPVQVWATSSVMFGGTILLLIIVVAFITGLDRQPIELPFNEV
ncbi:hypothetical protein B0H13DRAFT_2278372 [Mycena leptocephala]|nr:hypothetical protein B0H13DRAFT_2278372 [Mycena leptocephala]